MTVTNNSLPQSLHAEAQASGKTDDGAWLVLVAEKVKTMRFGVVQIVVHDSKVVQIERTERTRFEVPKTSSGH